MRGGIPYHANPSGTHCSQACLRMGYEYFSPDRPWSWAELDALTGHIEGLTTWNMRAYIETSRLGYDVVVFDPLDYKQLAENPKTYILKTFSPEYAETTFRMSDMGQVVEDSKALLDAHALNLVSRSYGLDEFRTLLDDGYLIATWVDMAITNEIAGQCYPHFILVYGYDDEGVFAHDPGGMDISSHVPDRHIEWGLFERANKINDKGERGEALAFRKTKDVK